MRVVLEPDAEQVAECAAERVAALVQARPTCTLALPTGRTPLGLYAALARRHRAGLSFAGVVAFNLDEYVGLGPDHPQSFARFLREALYDGLDLPQTGRRAPDAIARDLKAACAAYEASIAAAGGLDLAVLGLGVDGHVAFNEPGSSLGSRTRVKTLTAATRRANAAAFAPGSVPRFAITLGIGTLLEARSILLLACGAAKAEAVQRMVEGPVTAQVPATALQLHPDATIVLDEAAGARLERRDYYRETEAAQRALERGETPD